MQRAIIYCRVSTEEQAEDGHHSLAAQESLCRRSASEKQFEIAEVFSDPGKSATTMNRPGLKDALARCQSDHSVKAFFVQDTDRLARNTGDHLTIRAILKKHDVRLISVSQPMLEDSAEGMMIDTIIASVNQFQSDITSRKTMKGLEEKVRNGGWPGIAPIGYKNVGTGPDGQFRTVVIDKESAPLVQKLFQAYATGSYSIHELNNIFYMQGLRSRTGRRIHNSKIHTMLQNKFYLGEVHWAGIATRGKHEPLIDAGVFAAVKAVLFARGGNRSRKRKHDFLLRGFLFCGQCGGRLLGEAHMAKNAAYYRCHKRGGCGPASPVSLLEADVTKRFSTLHPNSAVISSTMKSLQLRSQLRKRDFESGRNSLLKRKTAVEAKLHKLEAKWLDGLIDDGDFERLHMNLKKQLMDMENRLSDMEAKKSVDVDTLTQLIAFTRDLGSSYQVAPVHIKRLLLKLAWERLEVCDREIRTAIPTPLFRILCSDGRSRQTEDRDQSARTPSNQQVVRLGTEWGPKRTLNRTQKSQKVVPRNTFSSLMNLIDSDAAYIHHLLALYSQIQDGLKVWKAGTSSDFLDTKSTAR